MIKGVIGLRAGDIGLCLLKTIGFAKERSHNVDHEVRFSKKKSFRHVKTRLMLEKECGGTFLPKKFYFAKLSPINNFTKS